MKFRGETIALYHLNKDDRYRKLQSVCIRMGLKCRIIEESQANWTIGSIFHLSGYEPPAEELSNTAPEGEVLLMNGFTSRRLDEFLRAMAKAGVGKIPLKAIVTADNVKWTFQDLYKELCQEHEQIENLKK
jgi:hypothetical protein